MNPSKIFLVLAMVVVMPLAWAEHEVDHRYNIRGYLLDRQERGIGGQAVSVSDGDRVLAQGTTDGSGYYSLDLHLHNEDLRRRLRIRAGSDSAEITVRFDPADLSTIRVHHANFVAGRFVEEDLGRFRVPAWSYVLLGLVGIFAVLFTLEKRRKRRLRRTAAGAKGGTPPRKRKSGKTRRGKR